MSQLSRIFLLATLWSAPLAADGGVTFISIDEHNIGIDYQRQASPRLQHQTDFETSSPIPDAIFFQTVGEEIPQKPYGAPGVALLDYDNDGDLDIYVTNGPGANNSLFSNQLQESGQMMFEDVAGMAGVGARNQDSSGVCFGDIDNDGDHDLYVLGTGEPNRLFENQGDATFRDITQASGVGGGNRHPASCTFADVGNDGLLDIVIANTYDDWSHRIPDFDATIYPGLEHNQLFQNQGGNVFADVSGPSGLRQVSGMGGPGLSGASFTWAVSAADYDLDGDVDLFFADSQGVPSLDQGPARGFLRLFENDGTGRFVDITERANLDIPGNHQSVSLGDVDGDGDLDAFIGNVGDFVLENPPGVGSSRWYLNAGNGTFTDPGVGVVTATPGGWGSSVFDYDNDGDLDAFLQSGTDDDKFSYSNTPAILPTCDGPPETNCDPVFLPVSDGTDVVLTFAHGAATGDLNGDGFLDEVSVASHIADGLIIPFSFIDTPPGSAFDSSELVLERWTSFGAPGAQTFTLPAVTPGTVEVVINGADNGNGFVHVQPRGSIDDLFNATVARDGTGVIVFTDDGTAHVAGGGGGLASQGASGIHIGLDDPNDIHIELPPVDLELLWPGGVRTRVDGVPAGAHLVVPEIPCNFDTQFDDPLGHSRCLRESLEGLVEIGVLTQDEAELHFDSNWQNEPPPDTCRPNDPLCFNGGRFRIGVEWAAFDGTSGTAAAAPLRSDDSGLFWFFTANNWEMLVKVLDGCAVNNRFWVFAAATTNVEYTLTVTDSATGMAKSYDNQLGNAADAITDTEAFDTCDSSAPSRAPTELDVHSLTSMAPDLAVHARNWSSLMTEDSLVEATATVKATCDGQQAGLCLNDGRFSVTVEWETRSGSSGRGRAVPGATDDSGVLWFFQPDNWEMLVKVLNGCAINQHYWVFAAATTDVGYRLQVTDTQSGARRTYINPVGNAAPALTDVSAFARCP